MYKLASGVIGTSLAVFSATTDLSADGIPHGVQEKPSALDPSAVGGRDRN